MSRAGFWLPHLQQYERTNVSVSVESMREWDFAILYKESERTTSVVYIKPVWYVRCGIHIFKTNVSLDAQVLVVTTIHHFTKESQDTRRVRVYIHCKQKRQLHTCSLCVSQ